MQFFSIQHILSIKYFIQRSASSQCFDCSLDDSYSYSVCAYELSQRKYKDMILLLRVQQNNYKDKSKVDLKILSSFRENAVQSKIIYECKQNCKKSVLQLYCAFLIYIIFEQQPMDQRADHPHQVAVHLMKALRCCKDCYAVSQVDYAELADLQREKEKLALELAQMRNPSSDLQRMAAEVHDMEYLIQKVREENQIAYQTGLRQIQQVVSERQIYQKQLGEQFNIQIIAERERFKTLTMQIQKQMEHIRYLHRINEELVGKFCKY